MNSSANLFRVQTLDRRSDGIQQRIRVIEARLSDQTLLSQARQESAHSQEDLSRANQTLADLSARVTAMRIKASQSESTLYGGKIINPKELSDLQHEIQSLRAMLPGLEEQELQALEQVEQAESAARASLSRILTAESQKADDQTNLRQELAALEKEARTVQLEIAAARQSIAADLLNLYDRLRKQKSGLAVITVEEESCSGCGGEISRSEWQSARTGSELVFCQGCGRIIYGG